MGSPAEPTQRQRLLDFLKASPGTVFSLDEIAEGSGIPRASVSTVCAMAKGARCPITNRGPGQWAYTGPADPPQVRPLVEPILFHDDPGCPGHTTGKPVAACSQDREPEQLGADEDQADEDQADEAAGEEEHHHHHPAHFGLLLELAIQDSRTMRIVGFDQEENPIVTAVNGQVYRAVPV
jgi:hypothetical protein